jgi:hypothetical protein
MGCNFAIGHLTAGLERVAAPDNDAALTLTDLLRELGAEADDEHYQVYALNSRNEAITIYDGGTCAFTAPNVNNVYYKPDSLDEAIDILMALVLERDAVKDRFKDCRPSSPIGFFPATLNDFPLHSSSNHGNLWVVKKLAEAGWSINQRDRDGATPVMHAAAEGHYEICKYLIDSGADLAVRDNDGQGLADVASEYPAILTLFGNARAHRATASNGSQNAYAVFDEYALYDVILPQDLGKEPNVVQFAHLDALIGGTVEGYCWHHHQEAGRMQFIPAGLHQTYRHRGGRYEGNWAYLQGMRA